MTNGVKETSQSVLSDSANTLKEKVTHGAEMMPLLPQCLCTLRPARGLSVPPPPHTCYIHNLSIWLKIAHAEKLKWIQLMKEDRPKQS